MILKKIMSRIKERGDVPMNNDLNKHKKYNVSQLVAEAKAIRQSDASKIDKPTYHSRKLTPESPTVRKMLYSS